MPERPGRHSRPYPAQARMPVPPGLSQRENMSRVTDPITLWRTITQAGSIAAYVDNRLRELGYLVQRRETDNMSDRELADYKKSLKAEAAERRKVRKEAWLAYKA